MANNFKRNNWTDNPTWYVSVQDAGRTGLILGPFITEANAREWAYRDAEDGGDIDKHQRLRRAAEEADPWSVFYGFGMTKMANGYRDGVLNEVLRPDGLWTGKL